MPEPPADLDMAELRSDVHKERVAEARACLYTTGQEQGEWATQTGVSEFGTVTPTTVRAHHETLVEHVA